MLNSRVTGRVTVGPPLASQTDGSLKMSTKTDDTKVAVVGEQEAKQPLVMPVTRLVSRPSVRIVDGVLSAVKEVERSAA